MSAYELRRWRQYANVNGPLSPMLRFDAAVARAAAAFAGKHVRTKDFMPWPRQRHLSEFTKEKK